MRIATPRHLLLMTTLLGLTALLTLFGSSLVGSVDFAWSERWQGLIHVVSGVDDLTGTVMRLRLQRAATAFVTGACLGLAGALMQILLRNPLAEPYVLGLSGGAAVGALSAMLLGGGLAWLVDGGALLGALAATLLVALFSRIGRLADAAPGESSLRVVLTGAVLTAGWGAIITLLLALAPDGQLRNMVFWLMGDLGGASWRPWTVLPVLIVLWLTSRQARALNGLALGPAAALNLGISTRSTQTLLFLCASALTAIAVTSAGSIGFVGLIVPHACRMLVGHDHRLLLPAVTLGSGIFLMLADTLARTVMAPLQLPVGVITALIGVPAFLILLAHERR